MSDALKGAIASARVFLLTLPHDHPLRERLMFDFSTLTDQVRKLRTDRDAQKARADAQQKRADDLDAKLADADKQGAALLELLSDDVGSTPAATEVTKISTTVTAPSAAPSTVVAVDPAVVASVGDAIDKAKADGGDVTVSGPGIAAGATVVDANVAASTITLSHPVEADHVGDGSETLTITPPTVAAAPAFDKSASDQDIVTA